MTYEIRMKDIFAEVEAKVKFTTTMTLLKNFMHNKHYFVDEAMTTLVIVIENRQQYKNFLAKDMKDYAHYLAIARL